MLCTCTVARLFACGLAPLLFAIFLNPLLSLFDGPDFQLPIGRAMPGAHFSPAEIAFRNRREKLPCISAALFADDVRLSPDTRLEGWQEAFQKALDAVGAFAARWRFVFSLDAAKSALVWFQRRKMCLADAPHLYPASFQLCGRMLPVVDRYKYLGVWLERTLSWEPHFEHLMKAARFAAFQVQRLLPSLQATRVRGAPAGAVSAAPIGGPHFSAIRALVLGGVFSRCTYGIMFISGATAGVEEKCRRLEAIAVRPLRQAFGLPGSTHIRSILIEADCPPIALFRQQLLLSYARRCMSLSVDHPARMALQSSLDAFTGQVLHRDRRCHVADTRRSLLFDVLEAERRWGTYVISRSPGPADINRVNQRAWSYAQLLKLEQDAYAAQQAAVPVPSSPLVPSLSLGISVSPASPGPGDPLESLLAPRAAVPAAAAVHAVDLSLEARARAFREWQEDASGGAVLRSCKQKAGRSHYLYLESRGTAIMRARLRFNRCHLRASLHERGLAPDALCPHPPCRRAGVVESVQHALMQCPALKQARERCRHQLQHIGQSLTLSILLGAVAPLTAAQLAASSSSPGPVASSGVVAPYARGVLRAEY